MSEASRGLDTSAEQNKSLPDYFGYYTREVAELFLQDDDFLPFSSEASELAGRTHGYRSLFHDALGLRLSDIKKERLKTLLRQSVVALTGEVDEILDPVVGMCRTQSHLRCKKSSLGYLDATCEDDAGEHPQKKLKLLSSSSSANISLHAYPISCSLSGEHSGNEDMDVVVPGKGISNSLKKPCSNCHTTETSKWRISPEGPKFKQGMESLPIKDQERELFLGLNIGAEVENGEVKDDLQFLLENDASKVEEMMKKYSNELSTTLEHMEQKLEELLDIVMSNCRPMTCDEKLQLRKLIQNIPSRNLDRVVDIIRRRKPSEKYSCDEIHVDLEFEDNVTLWRLYYYVETVENARKLCSLTSAKAI